MAQEIKSVRDFLLSVKEGKYTSLGSYPKYWVIGTDGNYEVLSYEEVQRGWKRLATALRLSLKNDPATVKSLVPKFVEINWENADLYCDWSGDRIESAYNN